MPNIVQITIRTVLDPAGLAAANAAAKASASQQKSIWDKFGKDASATLGSVAKGAGLLAGGSGLLAMAAPLGAAGIAIGAFASVAIPTLKSTLTASTANAASQKTYSDSIAKAKQNYDAQMAVAEKALSQAKTAQQRQAALNQEHAAAAQLAKAEGGANLTLSQNTTKLTSSQQQLIGSVDKLKTMWGGLTQQMAPLVVQVASLGVKIATDLMPAFKTLATAGGGALESILKPLDALFKSNLFAEFTKTLATAAKQIGPVLGTAISGLLAVLMKLFIQVMPAGISILKQLLPAIVSMGTEAIPVITNVAKIVAAVITWLDKTHLLVPALWGVVTVLAAMKIGLLGAGGWIGLVVVAVALLAEGFTVAWKKSATFRDIIKDIAVVFLNVGIVIVKVNQQIVNTFLSMVQVVIDAAAKAFGWVPGIGPKLKEAAKGFDGFRAGVNSSFDSILNKMEQWKSGLSGATSTAHDLTTKMTADFNNQAKAAGTAKSGLDTYTASIKANGLNSAASKKDRQQLITDLENAGVKATTAKTDVANYTSQVKANGVTSQQAQQARTRLINDILAASNNAKQGKTDMANLSTAIKQHGSTSDAARSARQRLITDLINSGLDANTAKTLVNNLATAIKNLPSKNVAVTMKGNGQYTIVGSIIAASQGKGGSGNAAGGLAAGGFISGGTPGRDSVAAMLMPGEVVVPTHMVRGGAVDHLRGRLPGFASGGVVSGNLTPGYVDNMYSTFQSRMDGSMVSAMKTALSHAETVAIAAAKAAAAAFTASQVGNVGSGVARWSADVLKALSMEGLPSSLLGQVLRQISTESGGNPNAINNTDINAQHGDPSRGLLQTIGSTFAAYHWPGTSNNIYDPLANIAAAINYARHVYGPTLMRGGMGLGSGHGYAAGGMVQYDSGGWLMPGVTMAVNRTGAPERVIGPGGGGGGPITLEVSAGGQSAFEQFMLKALKEWVRIKGGGSVQAAFGYGR